LIPTRQLLRRFPDGEALKRVFFQLSADWRNDEILHLLREVDYLEDLAILQKRKDIDYKFVRASLGDIIVYRWELWEATIDEMRRLNDGRDNYPHFRALATRLANDDDRS
jgi:hypothetical protein